MYKGLVNSPETTITNNISNTDTLIYVLDPTRVPSELPNLMTIGTSSTAETIRVLSIDGNAITVERGVQGTPIAWNAGTIIARNFTEYDYEALRQNVTQNVTDISTLNASLSGVTNKGYAITTDATGDLNNLKANGKYGAIGTAVSNCPDNVNSFMIDVTVIGTTYVIQEASPWWNPNTIRYRRAYNNGTWTAWKLISTTETTELTLLNGWSLVSQNYKAIATRSGKMASINLWITGGTTVLDTVIAQLPTGFTPPTNIEVPVITFAGTIVGNAYVLANGNIGIASALTSNVNCMISIVYPAV